MILKCQFPHKPSVALSALLLILVFEGYTQNGNVGIGTSDIRAKLEVAGGLLVTSNLFIVGAQNQDSFPVYTMGIQSGAADSTGILYDSGGPEGGYGNNESLTFTIKPNGADFIRLTFEEFDTEEPGDSLQLIGFDATNAEELLYTLSGMEAQTVTLYSIVRLEFRTNGSVTKPGFKIRWDKGYTVQEEQPEIDGGRLQWIPDQYALRSGYVASNSDAWDYAKIGRHSTAFGFNTMASGYASLATGFGTRAIGYSSSASGLQTSALGTGTRAWGDSTIANAPVATSFGFETQATAFAATVWGIESIASGSYSTAWGSRDTASGVYATAWGLQTKAASNIATAWGTRSKATGTGATAWGINTVSSAGRSTAWGSGTVASFGLSTAFGLRTEASGQQSTAWGDSTIASGYSSSAWGTSTQAIGLRATSWGRQTEATNELATVWGLQSLATGALSTAWGGGSTASGFGATVWGFEVLGSGIYSTAWGRGTKASLESATAWGDSTVASGTTSTAWGAYTDATDARATAWGQFSRATEVNATAWGRNALATGFHSTAWGDQTESSNESATAWGFGTIASGFTSTASGNSTEASGWSSTAMGSNTKAESLNGLAIGRYNVGGGASGLWSGTDPLFEVGIGSSDVNRSNALTILKNGNVGIGTPTPDLKLQITGGSDLSLSSGGYQVIGSTAGTNLAFDNNEIMARSNGSTSILYLNFDGGEVITGGPVSTGSDITSGGDLITAQGDGVINAGGGAMSSNINYIGDSFSAPTNVNGDEDLFIQDDLQVGSDAFKPGGGSWSTASDKRLKTDIETFTDGLDQVLAINPVSYKYNSRFEALNTGKTYVGVLAQDVMEVAPYMVSFEPFGQIIGEDENGNEYVIEQGTDYYTYDASALPYMLVNAVKEQQQVITDQQQVIDKQQSQLDDQSALIQQLLQRVEALEGN